MNLVYRVEHHAYFLSLGPVDITVDFNFTPIAEAVDIRFLQCKSIDLKENDNEYKTNEWWHILNTRKDSHRERL